MIVTGNTSKNYPNSNEYDDKTVALAKNHINNKANPHSVTASQVGAAEKVHSHNEVFLSDKIGTADLTEYASSLEDAIEVTSNTIKNISLFDDAYFTVPILVRGMMNISAVSRSNTCTIILNGVETYVVNGGKFEFKGKVESLSVSIGDGYVMFDKFDFLPSTAGFMTPEMLEKLLASIDSSVLENALKDYITKVYVESNYYTKDAIDEKVEGVMVTIDSNYSSTSNNAQSGKAVAQAIANLVGSSPSALDTINELAKALGNDPNFATTIATEIGKKANVEDVYFKSVVDSKLADKVGYGYSYSKSETDAVLERFGESVVADVNAITTGAEATLKQTREELKEVNKTLESAETTLENANNKLADVYTKAQTYSKDEVYAKGETYNKTEVDAQLANVYTKEQTDTKIAEATSALIDSSPKALDTLKELATALGNDPNFATTVMQMIGEKANREEVYARQEVDAKIDSAVADIDISRAANAFEGSASGEIVVIDDVSPIVHNMDVKASGTKVYAFGKNLISFPYTRSYAGAFGVEFTALADGGIKVKGTNTGTTSAVMFIQGKNINYEDCVPLKEGTYFVSGTKNDAEVRVVYYEYEGATQMSLLAPTSFTVGKGGRFSVYINVRKEKTVDEVIYPMVELGDKATEWEKGIPYKEYAVTDGVAKVVSAYPNMVLYADEGAIEAEYNKDSNKVITDVIGAVGGDYVLVGDATLTEDASGFSFSKDLQGNDLTKYKDFFMYFVGKNSGASSTTVCIKSQGGIIYLLWESLSFRQNSANGFWHMTEEVVNNNDMVIYKTSYPENLLKGYASEITPATQGLADNNVRVYSDLHCNLRNILINNFEFCISGSDTFVSGSRCMLFGRLR